MSTIKSIARRLLSRKIRLKIKRIKFIPINIFCGLFHTEKSIVFESNPDLACNSYAVFRYMLQERVNEEYKLIWLVRDTSKYIGFPSNNVFFIPKYPKSIREKLRRYFICYHADVSICCNLPLPYYCVKKGQLNIYLDHGSPLKDMTHGKTKIDLACEYYISQAPFFHKFILETYEIQEKQIVCLGVPRNDQLFNVYNSLNSIIPDISMYKKTIIWVPTFRTSENGKRRDSCFDFPLGIPILYSEKHLLELNSFLKDICVLLIIKPHPAQDLNDFLMSSLSNIYILTNEEMLANSIQTNELLAQCDAMITDYSGIYYDYLLLDRPIGITLDDYNEYKNTTGFMFENAMEFLAGERIYSLADLEIFIRNVAEGVDNTIDSRRAVKELTNKYLDANSSKRVYEFIAEKMSWCHKGNN